MTPVGILVGTYFSDQFSGNTDAVIESVIDALAAGTFMYIAILEIMEEVFEKANDLWFKFFFIIFGFTLMAVLAIWT
jgi:zinc transporter 1/2/3